METWHDSLVLSAQVGGVRDMGPIYILLSSLYTFSRQYTNENNQFKVRSGKRRRRKLWVLWPQLGS